MSEHRPARPARHLAPVPSPGFDDVDLAHPLEECADPDDLLVARLVALHATLHDHDEVQGRVVLWLLGPDGTLVGVEDDGSGWPVMASTVPLLAAEATQRGAASVIATIHLDGARRPVDALARGAHRFGRAMGAARVPVRAVARVDVPATFLPPWTSRGAPA
jgi:hypothetical protein